MMVNKYRPEKTDFGITLYPMPGVKHESTVIVVHDCEKPGNELMVLFYDEDKRNHQMPNTTKIVIPTPPTRKITQFEITDQNWFDTLNFEVPENST